MLTKIKNIFSKDETKNSDEKKETLAQSGNVNLNDDNNTSADNTNNSSLQTTEQKADVIVSENSNDTKAKHSPEEVKEEVIKVLKTCYDPEIPVDVWELGLIYDIKVATNNDVLIVMTLTSPSCPVAGILPGEIEQKVKEHPMVNDCKVQLTFDPPWGQKMMSEVAKLELGFL